jgi:hypothetical protein
MTTSRDDIDLIDIGGVLANMSTGDDSLPLWARVIDQHETWGKVTSTGRTNSASYLAFVERHKDARVQEQKKRAGGSGA